MANLLILPAARAELDRAYAYYQVHGSQRAAEGFFSDVLDAFAKIAASPELWPAEDDEVYRFFALKRHSYVIYYRIEDPENVRVVAVPHSSQQRGCWRGR